MKILVTGCAGFIGFHLVRRLLAEGHEVVGADNLNDYYSPDLKRARLHELDTYAGGSCSGFTFIHADICDPELYSRDLAGTEFDLVCHLAAQAGVRYSIDHPAQYISSNVVGFFNILEYCRHNPVKRLVFASSSSVYGNNPDVPYREDDRTDEPVSLYGATKKAGEALAYSYASLYGIETVGLRFFTVYGPWGRPDMAPFIFTKAILEGRPVGLFNEGRMMRDFTYIDDIVEGILKVLLEEPRGGDTGGAEPEKYRIYNIGCSQPVELGDFVEEIERLTGCAARRNYLPMQPGDVTLTWADTSRLRDDYGYAPSTPLGEGLARFIEWYIKYYGHV